MPTLTAKPPVYNIHLVFHGRLVASDDLKLMDYEVCLKLSPYVWAVVSALQQLGEGIGTLEIKEGYVRALPSKPRADLPDYCQKALPKGLYGHLLDLSAGPLRPFPQIKELKSLNSWDEVIVTNCDRVISICNGRAGSGGGGGGGGSAENSYSYGYSYSYGAGGGGGGGNQA